MKFGTDGIRGVYGKDITPDVCRKIANGLTKLGAKRILLARDTRVSGEKLAKAVCEGACGAGIDVFYQGVATTPMLAFLTKTQGYDLGVMLTASHNPKEYNGLKIVGRDGTKISAEQERILERAYSEPYLFTAKKGKIVDVDHSADYIKLIASAGVPLGNMRVVCDCANGAASEFAEKIFTALGAIYVGISDEGDGEKINEGCGALYPEKVKDVVLKNGADIGFAFDGDADRMIAVLPDGRILDGDNLLLAFIRYEKRGDGVEKYACSTIIGNSALDRYLNELGVKVVRTDVGDHNVTAKMIEKNVRFGSEQSGHLIDRKYLDTGDGLLAAAETAKVLLKMGQGAFDYRPEPQRDFAITCEQKEKLAEKLLSLGIDKYLLSLPGIKKVLIRPSGTEPKVRVTLEGAEECFDAVIKMIEAVAFAPFDKPEK